MPDPTPQDDALLARLNALKKSSVSFDPSLSSSITPSPSHTAPAEASNDLAARFARLGSASPSSSPKPSRTTSTNEARQLDAPVIAPGAPSYLEGIAEGVDGNETEANIEDERSLEELLSELGPREEWDISGKEQKCVSGMLKDIRTMLPEVKKGRETEREQEKSRERKGEEGLTDWENVEIDIGRDGVKVGQGQSEKEQDHEEGVEGEKKKTEDEETDDVIAMIMAELEISKKYDPPSPPPEDDKTSNPEDPGTPNKESTTKVSSGDGDGDFALPSAPSSLPSPSPSQSQAIEDDLAARMAALSRPQTDALGLPSAPSFAPARKPPKVQSSFGKDADDEVETWCIICSDDATLKCTGCDGDLYCQNCWMEGHRGESAGWEERRHKAVLYSKDKKKKKEAAV